MKSDLFSREVPVQADSNEPPEVQSQWVVYCLHKELVVDQEDTGDKKGKEDTEDEVLEGEDEVVHTVIFSTNNVVTDIVVLEIVCVEGT